MSTGTDRGFWWRLGQSSWLLLAIGGLGCLGGGAFIVLGAVMRRRSIWISGILYVAVAFPAYIAFGTVAEGSTAYEWITGVLALAWLFSAVQAFFVNAEWLRWRTRPGAATPPLVPPPGYATAPPDRPAPPAEPVDVNAAGVDEIAALPHFDIRRAALALAARDRLGGFTDVYQFSDVAGLQPHEYVRVLPLIVAHPAQPPPPPPPQNPAAYPDRIVDV
ncbi:helix-hairpin-helix domain-containing protein [Asanoa siamensis]|uniref:Helix-hairpin-helix protein n=1 Tax=Asanoa siamensis TaxID=926357 RepID=A0ABQ4CUX6_9ACTN|nr:helix-hairpin-helix domain-containing protein [Asanoa siamensis]GIF75079.1 hypothetical protein Asi02nite_45970 [Asanoa siamensis]